MLGAGAAWASELRMPIMSSFPNALNYFYEFSPLLIQEPRSILEQFNAGALDAGTAFAAWRKALDEEIAGQRFHDFAVEQFSPIMGAIAQGEDDVMLFRDIGRQVFLRVLGKEVDVLR